MPPSDRLPVLCNSRVPEAADVESVPLLFNVPLFAFTVILPLEATITFVLIVTAPDAVIVTGPPFKLMVATPEPAVFANVND